MVGSPMSLQDAATQLTAFKSYVQLIADSTAGIVEKKLKAAQELSENFESVVTLSQYPLFLAELMRVFLKILDEGEPQFIAEQNIQQLRKLLLEIIHRIPCNDHLKKYVQQILTLMFRLLKIENEDNVLVCIRIILELHKQYRPQMNEEITEFMKFVKGIYSTLPNHLPRIFEPRSQKKVKDLTDINVEVWLQDIFTVTTVLTDKKNAENQSVQYNIIPMGVQSLKVLAELPVIVVLMYQMYKQQVQNDMVEFIPLIMNTITLQPSAQHRNSPNFNKEVFVDFIAAQIKTLSFLAYIIKIYQFYHYIAFNQGAVNSHSQQMVQGLLGLMSLCPQEVAHLRKELLMAARHILSTDLRNRFVPVIDKLFDENILIGSGWTTYESLRPLAYSTLADLVHHVRNNLSLHDLSLAVNLFSKNVHDDSLPSSIQTMSCKLLLNLVDCIRTKSDQENGNGRELLLRMSEVFVIKFKTVAKVQLPLLLSKCKPSNEPAKLAESKAICPSPTSAQVAQQLIASGDGKLPESIKDEKLQSLFTTSVEAKDKEDKPMMRFGAIPNHNSPYSVSECRSLMKTLVCGVKTITWGTLNCKAPGIVNSKQFMSKEILVYVRLLKYALKALDIYTICVNPNGGLYVRSQNIQNVKVKEEKEALEHFAGVFTMLTAISFKEIFSSVIEYMVDRIHGNFALQIVANSFLAHMSTSATFATILVEYLLERIHEMGSNMERSNLYLKLFKMVFGSVSLFAAENEQMLKPHLHTIVNRSMELALSANEPYNYFLLLRALFRSIGGGSHDLLYQEFLPLLPNLLQGLNSLQSGLHRQHMKDLFVELCLTVPVRLSSLLPYLPMLMDPLVSALNGSQTLINQGLRTLELCVDNLQPDFLYDHIQPVRAELMQALWRTLKNPQDATAATAFRVLGKFGGGNRKMLREPQMLQYNARETVGPCINITFQESKTPISLPVEKAVEFAVITLKNSMIESYNRRQAYDLIRCFLISVMNLEDDKIVMTNLFSHPSFKDNEIVQVNSQIYKNPDSYSRKVHEQALTGMFVAAAIKDLRSTALQFMASMVRHCTLITISQQCGPFPVGDKQTKLQGMDTQILVDALATIMGHEEKELCKPGNISLVIIIETATIILGSKERACQLPLFEYVAEKMCDLCYNRAWYSKYGGCLAIKSLYDRMSFKWVLEHQYTFLKALLFVINDLTSEVSSGAVELAQKCIEEMLRLCARPLEGDEATEELIAAQKKSLHDVAQKLIPQITTSNTLVRQQCMKSLKILSEVTKKTVTEIMEPHKELLADMIPPKKHLLRNIALVSQIGLMEGYTFCVTLEPRLFNFDANQVEHTVFFNEVFHMCDVEENVLMKQACYKNITNLVPLKKSALKALAACNLVLNKKEKIFQTLYKALNSSNSEIQETAHESMKMFMQGCAIDVEMAYTAMRPLLSYLSDFRSLTLSIIKRLSSLVQLFPNSFNEKLCESMQNHLKKWIETAHTNQKSGQPRPAGQVLSTEVQLCAAIINMFHLIPAASKNFIEPLTSLSLVGERALLMEASSPFREPLLKFQLKYPAQVVDMFLTETALKDQQWFRYFEFLLHHKDGGKFCEALRANPNRLANMLSGQLQTAPASPIASPAPVKSEVQYRAVRLVALLVRFDETWLPQQPQMRSLLLSIWVSDSFLERHKAVDELDYIYWKEPALILKCLVNYFKHHTDDCELLFHILRCFIHRFIPQFQFVKDFLDETVAKAYTADWKRKAFFKFVSIFHDPTWPQELKAKILQYILIPCFYNSFEKGEGDKLIGGPPAPDQDNEDNVISVFINRIIDPENPFGTSDAVRILLLQFSSLLVEQASSHIHDAANKKQGNKLRRLMTFAWPCLVSKNCVDPATKYHGHLLLAHIIAKFAIHKRIVLQVFHSLLKAHANEAKMVVRQSLEYLTPAMPSRMEDGNGMLTHWTKKIIVEEGHSVNQLVHILQLVVRHYKVYYPVRHSLLQHMVSSLQRLGFSLSASLEHRKLAVDLADIIIKWELMRIKEDLEASGEPQSPNPDSATAAAGGVSATPSAAIKRSLSSVNSPQEPKKVKVAGAAGRSDVNKPIDKQYCDCVANFLLRIACQVNEAASGAVGHTSAGEMLSKRCVALLKLTLRPDVWPNVDLKLSFFDKLLSTATSAQPNISNIVVALELLEFLIGIMKKEMILSSFKPLQRGISICMNCNNTKVIRAVHKLLMSLMSIFPTESANCSVASKYEELEALYACVSKLIYEGLTNYDKNNGGSPSLFSTLMILKSACENNQCYIDRLITIFMKVLTKMTSEHLKSQEPNPANRTPGQTAVAETDKEGGSSELLILSLDLVKNRVGVMSQEMRKSFIGNILAGLIERTSDSKVMRAITKMVEDWIKNKSTIAINQSPSTREKCILLSKLMSNIERRFPGDIELNSQFLDLVLFIYRDKDLERSDLTTKLENAFLAGLRCNQHAIRQKFLQHQFCFFQTMEESIPRKLFDRLLYLMCSQNWENMGIHFWIKQALELLLVVAVDSTLIQSSSPMNLLPSVASVINLADSQDRADFAALVKVKEEPMDVESLDSTKEEEDIELELPSDSSVEETQKVVKAETGLSLKTLLRKETKFLDACKEVKTQEYLTALCQLAHNSTDLAHITWLDLFPRIWKILTEKQQERIKKELVPFLTSGAHVNQRDCHPSAVHTLVEGAALCVPPITIKACALKYLARSHNLWHRSCLLLEHAVSDAPSNLPVVARSVNEYDFEPPPVFSHQETLDCLCELYELLQEEDMFVGLWQKRARYPETNIALAYMQHGFFEQAQSSFEGVMSKIRMDHNTAPTPREGWMELKLIENCWIKCAKELNQWDNLLEYANSRGNVIPELILDCAWRVPNWPLMKDALGRNKTPSQVEGNYKRELQWKMNLYRGYLAICHSEEHHLNSQQLERLVETCGNQVIKEWRRLPGIVSQIHVQYLQAAQMIMELQEAAQINQGLQPANLTRTSSVHDMKAIVKTWKNRLPMISDDLSHWSDIFTWRQHHYKFIIDHYESQGPMDSNTNSMMGVHATAQSIIHFGKIARKHGLVGVSLDTLSRIHSIASVPVVDCFQKVRQQVKCYMNMTVGGSLQKNEFNEGLEVIEVTNLKFFSKEMMAELYGMKGYFLQHLNRSEESNKVFSAAIQLHDTCYMAWAWWGEYLEALFTRERNMDHGESAVICYLHSCRSAVEGHTRKYLAKAIWLLTYDDENLSIATAIDKYHLGIQAIHWLPWIPQLLTCLVRKEGKLIMNLLTTVGRMYPQAVYFPVRTLYFTLKLEQRERHKKADLNRAAGVATTSTGSTLNTSSNPTGATPSPATTTASGTPGAGVAQSPSVSDGLLANTVTDFLYVFPDFLSSIPASTANSQTPTPGQTPSAQAKPDATGSHPESIPIKAPDSMWRCSKIIAVQRDTHPTVLTTLEGIVEQIIWFRENWYEEVLRQLRQGLEKCYGVAFENRASVTEATITPHTLSFVKKIVSTFGVGVENVTNTASTVGGAASESLARRAQATAQDPVFQKMKSQFTTDFDFSVPGSMKLHNLINKLKKWIKILEAKTKLFPKSFLIEEKCSVLSNFTASTAEIEMPGEFLLPKHNHYYVRIARFMPRVEIVQKHNTGARRLYIRGQNGKEYPYLIVNDGCLIESRREERTLQLLRMLNQFLTKQKETSRRLLYFTVPRVLSVSPQLRLIEDNPASISLLDIYKQRTSKRGIEHDAPIARYYERLATVQARGSQASHQVLRDILKEVQTNMVPRGLLKEWALNTFLDATDYWTFRKTLTIQLALMGLAEFVFHLTRMNPDQMYLHQDCGYLNISFFKFDIDDQTGDLDANRPVPFRLTPNIAEFLTHTGVIGPLTAAMVATARCLVQPQYKLPSLLRTILRDEYITWHKKKMEETNPTEEPPDMEGEQLVTLVNKAVSAITTRVQNLASFEGAESRVSTLVIAATNTDNLCRMDPAWHPWL
ncbi:transformation/transcription domain-associated protein-like isoform X5 [Biomphalaria glabrata]|uniref:Transformation/transcription domain-associated protein-like isoform X5 n=1 Tax=Biomphalaria glabrata TaxID=6526 RepID=A0A9W2ZH51_BIOGL|nr:transformation/transcription domain-associated protein-like isoform X5 [Biomphalaria glabrata]